jgi:hypothetical protein
VADHSLVILLGLAYCCLTPLVTPFCLLYFALTLLSQKYQLIYVLQHAYEAEGRMWITVRGEGAALVPRRACRGEGMHVDHGWDWGRGVRPLWCCNTGSLTGHPRQ